MLTHCFITTQQQVYMPNNKSFKCYKFTYFQFPSPFSNQHFPFVSKLQEIPNFDARFGILLIFCPSKQGTTPSPLLDWEMAKVDISIPKTRLYIAFEHSYFLDHIAHPPFLNSSIHLHIMCKIARENLDFRVPCSLYCHFRL